MRTVGGSKIRLPDGDKSKEAEEVGEVKPSGQSISRNKN